MSKHLNPATAILIGVLAILLALATWTVFGTGAGGDDVDTELLEETSPTQRTGPLGGGPIESPEGVIEPTDDENLLEYRQAPENVDPNTPIIESADEPGDQEQP